MPAAVLSARQRQLPGADVEPELIADISSFYGDPLGFVRYVFPWGEPGLLEREDGPDKWQAEFLQALGERVRENTGPDGEMLVTAPETLFAAATGMGVSKTAVVAWLILWFMSTREFPQIPVTSNTQTQLLTKTWRELAKWHRLALNRHWFEWTATRFYHRHYPETWYAAAIPWSEHNSEAFAGTHEKHVLVVFDEASAIPDPIWEVVDGAMSTPGAIWLAFGNPTRNTGRFRECFGRFAHRWRTWHVDARHAKKASRARCERLIEDWGEDHDLVRVRVRGLFPSAGSLQFIDSEIVYAAQKREALGYEAAAKVLSVDVARHGDDETVISRRQGYKLFPQVKLRLPDLMQIAMRIGEEINEWNPDATFVDASGMGWGVVDKLRELGFTVTPVQTGEAASDPDKFYNLNAEVWARMKEWLQGADLPDDPELAEHLTGREYGFDNRMRVKLERKENMKERGLSSPDCADSLSVGFAAPVASSETARVRRLNHRRTSNWRV